MNGQNGSNSDFVYRPEEEELFDIIRGGGRLIHISGEPGIGKSVTIGRIQEEFESEYDIDVRRIQPNHNLTDLYREVCHSLFEHLPDDVKEGDREINGVSLSGSAFGFGLGGGLSWGRGDADASRAQFGYRDALLQLGEVFPADQNLLICVDDIHEFGVDERQTKAAIEETSESLPGNVVLVTAGRLAWDSLDTSVSLSMFTEGQTVELLQDNFRELEDSRARRIHRQLGGHPLYIGLLIESNEGEDVREIPETEVYREIEERYLQFLDQDERRILRGTAPLRELNEEICAGVIPDAFELDRVDVSDILDSLSTRSIVQTIGRNRDGLKTFKVHDVFREFLEGRWDRGDETRKRACVYYSEKLIQLTGEESSLETEVEYVNSWARYLSDEVIHDESDIIASLISEVIADDGLNFYPSSLVVEQFKSRDAANLPDEIVEALLDSIQESSNMSNFFYDEQLDGSWFELLFDRGEFDDPEGSLVSYLAQVTDEHPEYIRRVAENIETEDERTLRFLISLSREIPVREAAEVGQLTAVWIDNSDAYHDLSYQGLRLAKYLGENGELDTALEIIDTVLRPRDFDDVDQLEGFQGMVRYNLTEALTTLFDDLIADQGEQFIDSLESNIRRALDDDSEQIAAGRSLAHLNFVEENRGNLKELLLEYYTRAVTDWIGVNPAEEERKQYIGNLLSDNGIFRRVGLRVLGEYSESFSDLVQDELTNTENFEPQPFDKEFYLTLENGFEHIDEESQNQVCQLILDGPYTDERVEDRAEQLAERGEEPPSYFEQRLRETWRRDRLLMIRDSLNDEFSEVIEELLEKYGEPDRLPSEPYRPDTSWGLVNQRGPESTEELRQRPVEEVLSTAVEWEPPESQGFFETGDSGQLEERNYLGFSRQLRELIEENPERYAREISILEEANTRYAEQAFRAFRDLVDDGVSFPWSSLIELGQVVVNSPSEWSSPTKTNLSTLLNKGIASDDVDFPDGHSTEVQHILVSLLDDSDPDDERDAPSEGMAGHGDPVQVAINSVRPMALNAFITYLTWLNEEVGEIPTELRDQLIERIEEDQSLAVRSVIGRRFGILYSLFPDLIESRIEEIFPRDEDTGSTQLFIAAWNSYTRSNVYRDSDLLSPYYQHAVDLLNRDAEQPYQVTTRSTAAHVVSAYLFDDDQDLEGDSLISRYYQIASPVQASEIAAVLASSMGNSEVIDRWDQIRTLWEWRLDIFESNEGINTEEHSNEVHRFLDCVRNSGASDLERERGLIVRSLPFVVTQDHRWRMLEGWFAEQSTSRPDVSVELYEELVNIVSSDNWSSIARTSRENDRRRIYENAESTSQDALQTALGIADSFASENQQMDREFLESHL